MQDSITWIHISDLHASVNSEWNFREVRDTLVADISRLTGKEGLRPDFIFFTGDLAFGSRSGDKLDDQYKIVQQFLDSVLNCFDPPINKRNLYVVPGNHDIDRGEITDGEMLWLRASDRQLAEVVGAMRAENKQWRSCMDRFIAYRKFLKSYGLTHLAPDDAHLVWNDVQNVGGYRVGISGFNSAWSAAGPDDKGKLWAGLEFQISKNTHELGPVDLSFALIHHPGNWLVSQEDPAGMRLLRSRYQIVLHGHEHTEWIEQSSHQGLLISAGACYESSWMANGYNIGHLNIASGEGAIRLREWDQTGRGWVEKNVANRTLNGVWPIRQAIPFPGGSSRPGVQSLHLPEVVCGALAEDLLPFDHYTAKYCKNALDKFDYLELFGCDIPRELQRHQLSVAYVSLNLSPENTEGRRSRSSHKPNKSTEDASQDNLRQSSSISDAIEALPPETTRLVILGPAGAGKSTLLRWCAMYAASNVIAELASESGPTGDGVEVNSEVKRAWCKVPVLLRLRDFKDGKLPPAESFPRVVAKHLQAAPHDWMISLLSAGDALILLDGVDEINSSVRPVIAAEIEDLVRTYPKCTYVITSRQGAVPPGWLERIDFVEMSVQPMDRQDREKFIDKWYLSASQELSNRVRGPEDLIVTSSRLKAELVEQGELGVLASNPLVCAMICALYRERQETLPESPSDLCEALTQMLVHRRERESPGLSDAHFDVVWRTLRYTQKRGLLAEIAWDMVSRQVSTIDRNKCGDVVRRVVSETPGHNEDQTASVLTALIERSGLLRPAGEDQVEFIHNTLKEYLSACHAVENSLIDQIHSGADDPSWQPIILFALSLASEAFSSKVVQAIMGRLSSESLKGRKRGVLNRGERLQLARDNARAFFLVRCKKSAKRLDPELSAKIEQLMSNILPPAYMQDVEPLAQLGNKLLVQAAGMFDAPKWWANQDVRTAARSLRLMRMIGGTRARAQFLAIQSLPSDSTQLNAEWMIACTELAGGNSNWPFANNKKFDIRGSNVSDIRPLAGVPLRALSLALSKVERLDSLQNSLSLISLDIDGAPVSDLSPISLIAGLRTFSAIGCPIAEVGPLPGFGKLETLDLEGTKIADIPSDVAWGKLRFLDLRRTRVSRLEFLERCADLTHLNISFTKVDSILPVGFTKNLSYLDMQGLRVSDIDVLASNVKLRRLYLRSCPVGDLSPLGFLNGLTTLNLDETKIVDLAPIRQLSRLTGLSIAFTGVSDISVLSGLSVLRSLSLVGSPVEDLSVLGRLQFIDSLTIGDGQIGGLLSSSKIQSVRNLFVVTSDTSSVGVQKIREIYPNAHIFRRPLRQAAGGF